MANRSRSYYRRVRKKAIERKKRLIDEVLYWDVDVDGKLNKGKIHCSCYICAFHGTTESDKRRLSHMESSLADLYEDDAAANVSAAGIASLTNKIRRKKSGRYSFPGTGFPGTVLSSDKKISIEQFKELLAESDKKNNIELQEPLAESQNHEPNVKKDVVVISVS